MHITSKLMLMFVSIIMVIMVVGKVHTFVDNTACEYSKGVYGTTTTITPTQDTTSC